MISVVFLYAVCALTFTLSKAALLYAQPIFFVALRMIIAGLLLCFFEIFLHRGSLRPLVARIFVSPRTLFIFLQTAFFHIYFAYVCDAWALRFMTSSESALFYNLSPFIAAILSFIVLKEVLSYRQIFGMVLGFIGMLPLCYDAYYVTGGLQHALARIVMILAVVSTSYGWILVRRLRTEFEFSSFAINGISMLIGGILALCTSLFFESAPYVTDWYRFGCATALLLLVSNVFFYNWYAALLGRYTATFLAFVGFLCPLWTAFFGRIFLFEPLNERFFVAFILVVIGLAVFYRDEVIRFGTRYK